MDREGEADMFVFADSDIADATIMAEEVRGTFFLAGYSVPLYEHDAFFGQELPDVMAWLTDIPSQGLCCPACIACRRKIEYHNIGFCGSFMVIGLAFDDGTGSVELLREYEPYHLV